MKKLILAVGLLGMIWGGGALAAPPADCATVSDPWNHANCERDCGKDSSLAWCDDICTEEPNAGHDWCSDSSVSSGSSDCAWSPVPSDKVVSGVTQDQADLILTNHCGGMTSEDQAVIFMSAGISQATIEEQICAVAGDYCN